MTKKDFDKKLSEIILPKFAMASDWSELMSIISNFKENLRKYSHYNMANLSEKIMLSRRLAYSLNPQLPGGLHEIVIEVYSSLLENIKHHNNNILGEDLGLYVSGLLPFFNNASIQNKFIFIEKIVQPHLLQLNNEELDSVCTGLIACLLPGLEEQNENLIKLIKEVFTNLKSRMKESYIYGCIWMIIMRTPKLRKFGMKYLTEYIPNENQHKQYFDNFNDDVADSKEKINTIKKEENIKDISNEEFNLTLENNNVTETEERSNKINLKKISDKNIIEHKIKLADNYLDDLVIRFYPDKSILVLNSIKSLIEDKEVVVQRITLDFLISRLPINSKLLNEKEKIAILISVLTVLTKNDHSLTRRIFSWLFNNSEDDPELGDPIIQNMIDLTIKSLCALICNNACKSENISKLSNVELSINIIDVLFKQQVKLVDYILPSLSWCLLNSIYECAKLDTNILRKALKLFNYDLYYIEILWSSLGKLSNYNYIKRMNNHLTKDFSDHINESFEYNSASKYLSISQIKVFFDEFPFILQFSLDKLELKGLELKYNYYLPILSNILNTFISINNDNTNFDFELLKKKKNLLLVCLNMCITMYVEEERSISEITHGIAANRYSQLPKTLTDSLKISIANYEKFYISIVKNLVSDDSLDQNKLKLFQHTTEIIVKVQVYKDFTHMPEWLIYLIKLIFSTRNVILSLEALEFILDLLVMKNENDEIRNIKLFLRQESLEYILDYSQEISKNNEKSFDYKTSIDYNKYSEDSSTNILNNIVKDINNFNLTNPLQKTRNTLEFSMAKLWKLIPDQSVQRKVIDLLVKFSRSDPDLFSSAVSSTLNSSDLEMMVSAINIFNQFWKLTAEFYPDLVFFGNGECTFKLLDYLEHNHPLVRHVSKSWLSQTLPNFNKILDPLLCVLLNLDIKCYISPYTTSNKAMINSNLFNNSNSNFLNNLNNCNNIIFTDTYDNKRVIEAFRKLKNVILNFSESQKIINYLLLTKPSNKIIELCEASDIYLCDSYFNLLIIICIRFIKGKFIQSINATFYKEHFAVNAASCEFLELMLSNIENKSRIFEISLTITEGILFILLENMLQDEVVMQVQLLNLLKVLLFTPGSNNSGGLTNSNSNSNNNNTLIGLNNVRDDIMNNGLNAYNSKAAETLFSSKVLHNCINLGITIDYTFVRTHFLMFLETCFPIFKEVLHYDENIKIGSKLLITSAAYLIKRICYYENLNLKKLISTDYKQAEVSALNLKNKNFFLIKNYLNEYIESKSYDENDIVLIIKGSRNILYHFLGIESIVNNVNDINWTDIDNRIFSSDTLNKFIYDKKFLGFFNNAKSNYLVNKNGSNNSNLGSSSKYLVNYNNRFFNSNNISISYAKNYNSNSLNVFKKHKSDDNMTSSMFNEVYEEVFSIYEELLKAYLKCWVSNSGLYLTKDLCLSSIGIVTLEESAQMSAVGRNIDGETVVNNTSYNNKFEIDNIANRSSNNNGLISNIKNTGTYNNINISSSLNKKEHFPYSQVISLISNINLNLYIASPMDYMYVYIKLWVQDDIYKKELLNKLYMIELICSLSIPLNIIIKSIYAVIDQNYFKFETKSKIKNKDGTYPFLINYNQCLFESKICHLVFSLFCYTKYIESCWQELLELLELLNNSKSPSTWIWLYELLNTVMIKHPFNKAYKIRIKDIFEKLTSKMVDFALLDKVDFVYETKTITIKPIPPTIYEEAVENLYHSKEVFYSLYGYYNENAYQNYINNSNKANKNDCDDNLNINKKNSSNFHISNLNKTKQLTINIEGATKDEAVLQRKIKLERLETKVSNSDNEDSDEEKINNPGKYKQNKLPINKFFKNLYSYIVEEKELKNEELIKMHKVSVYITLKYLYYNLVRKINPVEKIDKAIIHMHSIIKNILDVLIKKVGIDAIYIDLASEFLENIFSKSKTNIQLATIVKPAFINFFFDNDFFKMTRKSLKHWMNVVSQFAKYFPDLIEEIFENFSTGKLAFSSYTNYTNFTNSSSFTNFFKNTIGSTFSFKGKNLDEINKNLKDKNDFLNNISEAERTKIKLLRRISFVIYSCEKDTFKIMFILEKLKDILTTYTDSPALQAEAFLLIRIMFLRFSKEQLVELLRMLWPIIFAEMSSILFNKVKKFTLDLPLSCLKLIECLSLSNMEEFCMYQWSMVIDCKNIVY